MGCLHFQCQNEKGTGRRTEDKVLTGIHLGNLLFKGTERSYYNEGNLWLFKHGTGLETQ